jgi:hypothetical protein
MHGAVAVWRGAWWPLQPRDSQGEVAFGGQLWMMGGWFGSIERPPRDVWCSSNGKNWQLVTDQAGWRHSDFPMSVVFQGRMFMMGGWKDGRLPTCGASNEVWCSSNGKNWTQLTSGAAWSPRLSGGITVFDGKIWVIGGTENCESMPARHFCQHPSR